SHVTIDSVLLVRSPSRLLPGATLFPYTTLFRSGFDGLVVGLLARGSAAGVVAGALLFGFLRSGGLAMEITAGVPAAVVVVIQGRSEEHTSELQSSFDLVCRLLLEKKNAYSTVQL